MHIAPGAIYSTCPFDKDAVPGIQNDMFYISRNAGPFMAPHIGLAAKIAMGDHGWGSEMFTDKTPFTVVVVSNDSYDCGVTHDQAVSEAESVLRAAGYGNNVRVQSFRFSGKI